LTRILKLSQFESILENTKRGKKFRHKIRKMRSVAKHKRYEMKFLDSDKNRCFI